jgi:ATP-dependent RNA helicase SUPV3L1/SUV3
MFEDSFQKKLFA